MNKNEGIRKDMNNITKTKMEKIQEQEHKQRHAHKHTQKQTCTQKT